MTRAFTGAAWLVAMTLALAGCGGPAEDTAPATEATDEPQAGAAGAPWTDPDAPAGITVSDGRLTLPGVSGNPGAVYFTISNSGAEDQTIRSAWVAGAAMAMLHETQSEGGTARMRDIGNVAVPAGETVRFAPGGMHVMAMDLGGALEEGGQTEVTLTFTSGDKVSFPVEVRAPGDGAAAGDE